jgi:hypothetical protein
MINYDPVGNIRSKSIGTSSLTYQFDAANRLASVTGSRNQNFGYDVYGNVSSNSLNQFQYDDATTLRCVDCGTANEIHYNYDGAGIRVSEQKGALTTFFMYGSKGDLLYEVDTAGTTREYAYVGGRNIAKRETR